MYNNNNKSGAFDFIDIANYVVVFRHDYENDDNSAKCSCGHRFVVQLGRVGICGRDLSVRVGHLRVLEADHVWGILWNRERPRHYRHGGFSQRLAGDAGVGKGGVGHRLCPVCLRFCHAGGRWVFGGHLGGPLAGSPGGGERGDGGGRIGNDWWRTTGAVMEWRLGYIYSDLSIYLSQHRISRRSVTTNQKLRNKVGLVGRIGRHPQQPKSPLAPFSFGAPEVL